MSSQYIAKAAVVAVLMPVDKPGLAGLLPRLPAAAYVSQDACMHLVRSTVRHRDSLV